MYIVDVVYISIQIYSLTLYVLPEGLSGSQRRELVNTYLSISIRMSLYLSTCLSLSVCLFICLPVFLYPYVSLSVYLSISIRMSLYLSTCLSLYVCLSDYLSFCPCLSLVSLSVCSVSFCWNRLKWFLQLSV